MKNDEIAGLTVVIMIGFAILAFAMYLTGSLGSLLYVVFISAITLVFLGMGLFIAFNLIFELLRYFFGRRNEYGKYY